MNYIAVLIGILFSIGIYVFFKLYEIFKEINLLFRAQRNIFKTLTSLDDDITILYKDLSLIKEQLKSDNYSDVATLSGKVSEISDSLDENHKEVAEITQKFTKQFEYLADGFARDMGNLRKEVDRVKNDKSY